MLLNTLEHTSFRVLMAFIIPLALENAESDFFSTNYKSTQGGLK